MNKKSANASRILICGNDEFLVSQHARELAHRLVPEADRTMGLEIIDGRVDHADGALQCIRKVLEALQTPPFFGAAKVVWLNEANFLSEKSGPGQGAAVKEQVAALTGYLKETPAADGLTFLLSTGKIDKRMALFKLFKEQGQVELFEKEEKEYLAAKGAGKFLQEQLRTAGLSMSAGVKELFLQKAGYDSRQIHNEIEKLVTALGDRKTVTEKAVRLLTCSSREVEAWDIGDEFGRRSLTGALQTLRQLMFQRVAPIWLLSSLQGRIRELLVLREALEKKWLRPERDERGRVRYSWAGLPQEAEDILADKFSRDPRSIHPFRLVKLVEQARQYRKRELYQALQEAVATQKQLVTTSLPAELLLEALLLKTMPRGAATTAAGATGTT